MYPIKHPKYSQDPRDQEHKTIKDFFLLVRFQVIPVELFKKVSMHNLSSKMIQQETKEIVLEASLNQEEKQ